ncbi:MAG: hypothetical protein HY763_16305 [Planctomycetes bacterium]|nr:hypothetical protein [Planctomycetota bacterium]
MDSIVEARVARYLRNELQLKAHDTGAVLFRMRTLARVSGHDLDADFASTGLASGPEARIAAGIVDSALGGGRGSATPVHAVRQTLARWVRTTRPMGM